MFKLYTNSGTIRILDMSPNEKDIIDTIGEYITQDPEMRFMVTQTTKVFGEETDELYKGIKNMQQYLDYVEEYKERQKNIMELKKEILDMVELPKVKSLRKK